MCINGISTFFPYDTGSLLCQSQIKIVSNVSHFTYRAKKFGEVVYKPKHGLHTHISHITLVHKMIVEKGVYWQVYFSPLPSYRIPEILKNIWFFGTNCNLKIFLNYTYQSSHNYIHLWENVVCNINHCVKTNTVHHKFRLCRRVQTKSLIYLRKCHCFLDCLLV
jgi:hypothetical protein